MKYPKRVKAALMAMLMVFAVGAPLSHSALAVNVSARSAVVLELETGTVLYAKAPHEKRPMASTTKVMTALIAIENGNLDDIVVTDSSAYGVEGSSIYLNLNEEISLRDLLYGLMLRSGNDSAVAIACHIAGSVEAFAEMMNARAAQIGAQNTHFVNPHGLPVDDHYTTAYDLALICREAMLNPVFAEIVGTQYHKTTTGSVTRSMQNKDKLLWRYDGALGIKTGYTKAAGKCLTFAAERDGMTVVGAELNSPDMFPDAMALMDQAFAEYTVYEFIKQGDTVMRMQVDGGYRELLTVRCASSISVPVKKSEGICLTPQIKLNYGITAPVYAGEVLGEMELYNNGVLVGTCKLIAENDITVPDYRYYLDKAIGGWI